MHRRSGELKKNAYGIYQFDEYVRGKRVRQSLKTRSRITAELEAEKIRRWYGLPAAASRKRIEALIDLYLADASQRQKDVSLEKVRYILRLLSDRFGEWYVDDVTPGEANSWTLSLKTYDRDLRPGKDEEKRVKHCTRQPASVNSYLMIVKSFWNWLIEMGYAESSPFGKVKFLTTDAAMPRVLSRDELQLAIATMREHDQDMADALELLAITGMRESELLVLMEWKQVDFERGIITLVGTKGKRDVRRKIRMLPLTPRVRDILKKRRGETYPFMRTYQGKRIRLTPEILTLHFLRHVTPVLPGVSIHDLRRTFATQMAEFGLQENLLRQATGHAFGAVLDGYYIGLALDQIKEKMEQVEKLITPAA